MPSTGTPLGIGLAVDFASLDKDLGKVADHIENTGKSVSLKVGSLAGLAVKGDIKGDELAAQVAHIGIQLSQGMASGVRTSSTLMLGFGARINSMLDHLAGVAISLFKRIDSAMRFPRFDMAVGQMHVALKNLWTGARKDLSVLDVALGGGFGKTIGRVSKLLQDLFTNLGTKISEPIEKAISGIVPATDEMANRIVSAMDSAARSIARSMTTAIEQIISGLRRVQLIATTVGEASAEALMKGFTPRGGYRKYGAFAEPGPKRVTEARLAKSVGGLTPEQRAELLQKPAPPREFRGARPVPQMGKQFMALAGQSVQSIVSGFTSATKAVIDFNSRVRNADDAIKLIGRSMGGWGQLIALPLGAMTKMATTTIRLGLGMVDLGLVATRSLNRIYNLFTSIGGIGKKTYHDLYEGNNLFNFSVLATGKSLVHLGKGLFDLVTLKAFKRVGDEAHNTTNSIKATTNAVGKLVSSMGRLGVEVAAALGAFGLVYKVVEFLKGGTVAASNLNATVDKTKVIFGAAFGPVEEQAKKLETTYSIMEKDQLDAAAGFGNLAVNAGLSQKQAAKFSNEMILLSANLANSEQTAGGFSEAASNIQAALAGSTRSLREEAGQISAMSITQRALTDGFDQSTTAATNQATLFSRAKTITERLWFVQDNLVRTSNNASVAFRKAGGGVAIFAEKMGEFLMPVAGAATSAFNKVLGSVLDLTKKAAPAMKSWTDAASENITTLIDNIMKFGPKIVENMTWAWNQAKSGPLGFVNYAAENITNLGSSIPDMIGIGIRNADILWEIATLKVGEFADNAIKTIQTIPKNFQVMTEFIGKNWKDMLAAMNEDIKKSGPDAAAFPIMQKGANIGTTIRKGLGLDAPGMWGPAFKGIGDAFRSAMEATGAFKVDWGKETNLDSFPKELATATDKIKLPELIKPENLTDASAKINQLYDEIGKRELARPKFKPIEPEKTAMPGAPKPPEGMGKEYKLGGALEVGTKEAFSALSRSLKGKNPQLDVSKQSLSVQEEQLKVQRDHLTMVRQNQADRAALKVEIK